MGRIGLLLLITLLNTGCSTSSKIIKVEKNVLSIHEINPALHDSTIIKVVAPYKNVVDGEMNTVIGRCAQPLTTGEPEGLLGDFVADLSLIKANEYYYPADDKKIDFCFLNNGGLRRALPQGDLTRGLLFELMPFENFLVVLTLSGTQAKELLDVIAAFGGMPVSGVRFGIKDKKATNIFINGAPFDPGRVYKVTTSDYLAEGGENFKCLRNPVKTENISLKIRDAIIEFVEKENKKGNSMTVKSDGRIYIDK